MSELEECKKCVVAIDNGETIYISSQMTKKNASDYMENLRKEFVTPSVQLKLVSPGEAELLRETTIGLVPYKSVKQQRKERNEQE